ncbi:MAG: hypothetical protein WBV96_21215 [Polyangia bacterium]
MKAIQSAHGSYAQPVNRAAGDLYGLVYYLHAKPTQLDADNVSKPVWDALEGIGYRDDEVIKHRRAGLIDLRSKDLHTFDLSGMPDSVAAALISAVGVHDDIIYVEYGALHDDMYEFGLEGSV